MEQVLKHYLLYAWKRAKSVNVGVRMPLLNWTPPHKDSVILDKLLDLTVLRFLICDEGTIIVPNK